MQRIKASFRDPSGRVFEENGKILRTVTKYYRPHYDALMSFGLYKELTGAGLLVPHEELESVPNGCYKLISPRKIEFISYPYEWPFSLLKDAALLTLDIMARALKHGMWLKDASAYNVQLENGKPVFIDTLSFETREKGLPWVAYGQFCRHFLAPLLLMAHTDLRLQALFLGYPDGIPLNLASKLLPKSTRFKPGIALHIHMHANMIEKSAADMKAMERIAKDNAMDTVPGIVDSLKSLVQSIKFPGQVTEWGDYYHNTNYSDAAFRSKHDIVGRFAEAVKPCQALDLGANDGTFSHVAAEHAGCVVSADIDPVAVESNYISLRKATGNIVPLLLNLTNPTPGMGFANEEWQSFADRLDCDLVLALGLIHHVCISNNVPLELFAEYLAKLGRYVILEFVPKADSNAQRLLATRKDIFPGYTREGFEAEFGKFFEFIGSKAVEQSERTIYLLKRK